MLGLELDIDHRVEEGPFKGGGGELEQTCSGCRGSVR